MNALSSAPGGSSVPSFGSSIVQNGDCSLAVAYWRWAGLGWGRKNTPEVGLQRPLQDPESHQFHVFLVACFRAGELRKSTPPSAHDLHVAPRYSSLLEDPLLTLATHEVIHVAEHVAERRLVLEMDRESLGRAAEGVVSHR